jgi:Kef-type K+ transport system membrane component KefB
VIPESDYRFAQVLFLGTALAITAVPVAVKILLDLDRLDSRAGKTIVTAALVDDILSLVLLAVLTAVIRTGSFPSPADAGILIGKIVLFFTITAVVGRYLVARYFQPLVERVMGEEFEFSLLLVMALAFAVLAEQMGMHFIIGTFVAGLFFHDEHTSREVFESVRGKIGALTKGFLAPIFFASIGIRMEVGALVAVPGLVGLIILVAVAGKLLGAGLPAIWGGLSRREAATVGVGMSARGAVELIIAGVALQAGLFSHPEPTPEVVEHLFSAVVVMAIVTTLLTPIGLRWLLKRDGEAAG